MREIVLYAFIIVIGGGGLLITALPIVAWYRRRRWRTGLLEGFASSFAQGMVRNRSYDRDRMFIGDGWIDTYRGTVGTLPYVLSVTIEPWVKVKTYSLHLTAPHDPKTGEGRSQDYVLHADPERDRASLLVRFHADVRDRAWQREGYLRPEAS